VEDATGQHQEPKVVSRGNSMRTLPFSICGSVPLRAERPGILRQVWSGVYLPVRAGTHVHASGKTRRGSRNGIGARAIGALGSVTDEGYRNGGGRKCRSGPSRGDDDMHTQPLSPWAAPSIRGRKVTLPCMPPNETLFRAPALLANASPTGPDSHQILVTVEEYEARCAHRGSLHAQNK